MRRCGRICRSTRLMFADCRPLSLAALPEAVAAGEVVAEEEPAVAVAAVEAEAAGSFQVAACSRHTIRPLDRRKPWSLSPATRAVAPFSTPTTFVRRLPESRKT